MEMKQGDDYESRKALNEGWPMSLDEAMEHQPEAMISADGSRHIAKLLREGGQGEIADGYDAMAKEQEANPSQLEYTMEQHRRLMTAAQDVSERKDRPKWLDEYTRFSPAQIAARPMEPEVREEFCQWGEKLLDTSAFEKAASENAVVRQVGAMLRMALLQFDARRQTQD